METRPRVRDSMKKSLLWLLDHWYLPLFAVGVLLGWWLTRDSKRGEPLAQIKAELDAIKAGQKARELEAQLGAQQAADEVRKEHAAAVQALNAEQVKKAEALRSDPVALSKFLVRAGRRS